MTDDFAECDRLLKECLARAPDVNKADRRRKLNNSGITPDEIALAEEQGEEAMANLMAVADLQAAERQARGRTGEYYATGTPNSLRTTVIACKPNADTLVLPFLPFQAKLLRPAATVESVVSII